jgi:hypothetical protein
LTPFLTKKPLLTKPPPLSCLQKESSDSTNTGEQAADFEAGSGASELKVGRTSTAEDGALTFLRVHPRPPHNNFIGASQSRIGSRNYSMQEKTRK